MPSVTVEGLYLLAKHAKIKVTVDAAQQAIARYVVIKAIVVEKCRRS